MGNSAVCGSIREKISWARKIYEDEGKRLGRDREAMQLLSALEQAVVNSKKAMNRAGVLDRCRTCDTAKGGSCCGKGIEERYDGYLLLINLALGVDLPEERWDERSCFFLSPCGCCLRARHVICINYLCKEILDHVSPHALRELQAIEGEEIETLFRLKERIKKILRMQNNLSSANQAHG
jgi:hypothetical protein